MDLQPNYASYYRHRSAIVNFVGAEAEGTDEDGDEDALKPSRLLRSALHLLWLCSGEAPLHLYLSAIREQHIQWFLHSSSNLFQAYFAADAKQPQPMHVDTDNIWQEALAAVHAPGSSLPQAHPEGVILPQAQPEGRRQMPQAQPSPARKEAHRRMPHPASP